MLNILKWRITMIDFKTGVLNLNIKCPHCGSDYIKVLEEQLSPYSMVIDTYLVNCYNCCTKATIHLDYKHKNTQMIIIKWEELNKERLKELDKLEKENQKMLNNIMKEK